MTFLSGFLWLHFEDIFLFSTIIINAEMDSYGQTLLSFMLFVQILRKSVPPSRLPFFFPSVNIY